MPPFARGKVALLGAFAAVLCVSASSAPPPRIEKSLMGVHVLETADKIERIYHVPQRIYPAVTNGQSDVVPVFAQDANGNVSGAILSVFASSEGGGGTQTASAGFGRGGASFGRQGGGMGNRSDTGDINNRRTEYEEDAMAQAGANAKDNDAASATAMAEVAAGNTEAAIGTMAYMLTKGGEDGYTWVYLDPQKKLEWEVSFSRDNHVLAIIERGKIGGGRTSRGAGLGDSVASLYARYGWPERMTYQSVPGNDPLLVLNYSSKYHAQFAVLNNRVVGIAVFLFEDRQINFGNGSQSGGGGNRISGGSGPLGRRRPGMSGAVGQGGGGGRPTGGGGSGGAGAASTD